MAQRADALAALAACCRWIACKAETSSGLLDMTARKAASFRKHATLQRTSGTSVRSGIDPTRVPPSLPRSRSARPTGSRSMLRSPRCRSASATWSCCASSRAFLQRHRAHRRDSDRHRDVAAAAGARPDAKGIGADGGRARCQLVRLARVRKRQQARVRDRARGYRSPTGCKAACTIA